jgi:hypothetical protein
MGFEILGESDGTIWYEDININRCRFYDLGKVLSAYGMGVSFSGYSRNNIVQNCYFELCKSVACENAGSDYTTFLNNTYFNLKTGCKPWTHNGGDGTPFNKIGNRVINNVTIGTMDAAPQYSAQTGMFSAGNTVRAAIYTLFDNVDSCRFLGDHYIYTGTTHGTVTQIQNGSANNDFIACKFEHTGASGFTYGTQWVGAGTTNNKLLGGCEWVWGAGGGNLANVGSSATMVFISDHSVNGAHRTLRQLTTTERDNLVSPPMGVMIYNTTTNKINFRNGSSAWEAITSA